MKRESFVISVVAGLSQSFEVAGFIVVGQHHEVGRDFCQQLAAFDNPAVL